MADNLPEHVGIKTDPDPDQSEEDKKIVKMVMKKFMTWKKKRQSYDRNWLHYYKMFRGDQWDGIKMPRHRQKEIVNLVWQTIQSSVPLQTDVRPKFSYIPEEPSDKQFAEVLNKISEADWENNNWLAVVTEIILDGYLYGIGYGDWDYNDDADFGMGSVTFKSGDPFYIYPDPEAPDINFDSGDFSDRSEGLIVAKPVCTKRLKKEYPDKADLIKSDIKDVIQSSKTSLNDFKIRPSNTDRDMPDVTMTETAEPEGDKTLYICAYLLPPDTEEKKEEHENEEGEIEEKYILKKEYPYGRVIKIANGVLLSDEPRMPFENRKIPKVKYLNYVLPREFFGVSEVEQIESPQRVFNKILNAQLEIMNLMGNPAWIISTDSGVDPHQIVNRTGLIIQKEPGSEVKRVDGVQLSASALALIDRMETWFNNIVGTQEVTRGQTPGAVTAASAIEQLTENARTRIRQKQRNLDVFMRQSAQMYAEIILEKYTKERVFRVTNDEGSAQFFKFKTEKRIDDYGKPILVAKVTNYAPTTDDEENVSYVEEESKEYLIKGRFDVRVNTGSTLPFAEAQKEQKVLGLFDRGILDEQQVLEDLDYPNKEKILERLKQRQEAAAQAEAQKGG